MRTLTLKLSVFVTICAFVGSAHADEFKDYYRIYSTNNGPLASAEVILIGETHTVPLDQYMESEVLAKYAQPGDIVLVEGIGTRPSSFGNWLVEGSIQDAVSSKELKVGGWDNLVLVAIYARQIQMQLENADIILSNETTLAAKTRAALSAFVGVKIGMYIVNDMRENGLVNSLKQVGQDFPGRKIFLISGQYHLKGDWILSQMHRIGRPFSILIPREENVLRKESISAEAYARSIGN